MNIIRLMTKSAIIASLMILSVPSAFAGREGGDRHNNYRSNYVGEAHSNRYRAGYGHRNNVRRLKHQNRRLRHQVRKQRHYIRENRRAGHRSYGYQNYGGHYYNRHNYRYNRHGYGGYPFFSSYYNSTPGYSITLNYSDWAW